MEVYLCVCVCVQLFVCVCLCLSKGVYTEMEYRLKGYVQVCVCVFVLTCMNVDPRMYVCVYRGV